ncbi:hypothetical protein [Pseudovibrio ascidiaceicola]|uniref:hypothetical protein n=1 Tax=Pseudovibrio ascidiaceicola TaxID=285279 RepID=UPI000D69F48E|nr:hypothetical protein [Pseudovibrio ascidiaceicola]
MISNSKDVYKHLVEDSDVSWLLGLLAFAVIEERRIEWMAHQEQRNGEAVTEDEIRGWYEQQPENNLFRAKAEAENALQIYAQELEEEILDAERANIEEEMIINEVRSIRRPLADFGLSVAAGFVSAFIFAVLLTALAIIIYWDASPVDVGRFLNVDMSERVENGEKTSK